MNIRPELLAQTIEHLKLVLADLEEISEAAEADDLSALPPYRPRHRRLPPEHLIKLEELIEEGVLHPPQPLVSTEQSYPAEAILNQDATVNWNGYSFNSLSAAAKAVTSDSPSHQNGWRFWGTMHKGQITEMMTIRTEYVRNLPEF